MLGRVMLFITMVAKDRSFLNRKRIIFLEINQFSEFQQLSNKLLRLKLLALAFLLLDFKKGIQFRHKSISKVEKSNGQLKER